VLGRSFNLLVVLINMYKNRYDIIPILVSIFGRCIGRDSWTIRWEPLADVSSSRNASQ
jgi:hypothetical protein